MNDFLTSTGKSFRCHFLAIAHKSTHAPPITVCSGQPIDGAAVLYLYLWYFPHTTHQRVWEWYPSFRCAHGITYSRLCAAVACHQIQAILAFYPTPIRVVIFSDIFFWTLFHLTATIPVTQIQLLCHLSLKFPSRPLNLPTLYSTKILG